VTDMSRGSSDADRAALALRRQRLARSIVVLALVVLAIIFIAQNSQPVKVHFWFVNADPRLIWVIIGCLVVGGVIGYFIGRPNKSKRRESKS